MVLLDATSLWVTQPCRRVQLSIISVSGDDVPLTALETLMILDLVLISWLDSGVGGREQRGGLWQQK